MAKKRKNNSARQKLYFLVGVAAFLIIALLVYVNRTDHTQTNESIDSQDEIRANFVCSDGKGIAVEFASGSANMLLPDGRSYTLDQTPSAGGARYANGNESIVLWNVGDTVRVDENGTTIYSDCVANK